MGTPTHTHTHNTHRKYTGQAGRTQDVGQDYVPEALLSSSNWPRWQAVRIHRFRHTSSAVKQHSSDGKAKIFKSAQKSPYVISTVEPSQTDGGSALSDVEVFFEDEQGDETEKDKVTAEKCILRGAQLVNAAIGKKK